LGRGSGDVESIYSYVVVVVTLGASMGVGGDGVRVEDVVGPSGSWRSAGSSDDEVMLKAIKFAAKRSTDSDGAGDGCLEPSSTFVDTVAGRENEVIGGSGYALDNVGGWGVGYGY
jgi:hypothetical protein